MIANAYCDVPFTSTLEPSLGYRSFRLSRSEVGSDERSAGGDSDVASQAFEIFASEAPEVEERLFATDRDVIDDEVTSHVRERLQLGLLRAARASQAVPVACPPCKGLAAPNGWYLALAIRPGLPLVSAGQQWLLVARTRSSVSHGP